MSRDDFLAQEETAKILLEAMGDAGFVLAGSSAIRMHGLIDRPTRDIDLFAPGILSQEDFDTAVDTGFQALENHGWSVDVRQRSGKFVQFIAMKGDLRAEGDMGVDWRGYAPAIFSVGPVLNVKDSAASKVNALYARGLPRDFLDVDAIRSSGSFSDADLLQLAQERDPGFEPIYFVDALRKIQHIDNEDFTTPYPITDSQVEALRGRMLDFADRLEQAILSSPVYVAHLKDIGVSVPESSRLVQRPVSPVYSSPLYPRDGGYVSPVDTSHGENIDLSRDM